MASTQNPWEKYGRVPKANENVRNRSDSGEARTFEILDMKNMTKETITVGGEAAKKTRKRKPRSTPVPIAASVTPVGLQMDEEAEEAVTEKGEPQEEPLIEVKFITPLMETTVMAHHVHLDSSVMVLFTPVSAQVKVRPKRGFQLEVEFDGETHNIYSSGVYFPIEKNDWECSLFFVVPEANTPVPEE